MEQKTQKSLNEILTNKLYFKIGCLSLAISTFASLVWLLLNNIKLAPEFNIIIFLSLMAVTSSILLVLFTEKLQNVALYLSSVIATIYFLYLNGIIFGMGYWYGDTGIIAALAIFMFLSVAISKFFYKLPFLARIIISLPATIAIIWLSLILFV